MDGLSVSRAARVATDTLPPRRVGEPGDKPKLQSDNRSGFIAREFLVVLHDHGLGHHPIPRHGPEEKGQSSRGSGRRGRSWRASHRRTGWRRGESSRGGCRATTRSGCTARCDMYRRSWSTEATQRNGKRRKLAPARPRRWARNSGLHQGTLCSSHNAPRGTAMSPAQKSSPKVKERQPYARAGR
jgi:hypothetical protein